MKHRRYKISVFFIIAGIITTGAILFTKGTRTFDPDESTAYVGGPASETVPAVKDSNLLPELPAFRDFITFMEQELDSSHTVGAAYTIVHNGEVTYTSTYGERKRGSSDEVDEHTLFRLASVSKGFAGTLACLLELDGAFSLDDKELHDIVDRLDQVDISAPPGELYGYQNVLFSMLDPIARRATGVPYQLLLEEKIFKPLGMEDASAGPVDLDQNPNMAYPHVKTKGGYVPLSPHKGYYNVMPAAGVNASISDMGQWLLAMLGHMPEMMPDTVRTSISTPVIYTPLKWRYTRNWRPFRERYYSLGWRIYMYQGKEIVYHGGYIRGYRAEVAFCAEENVGIAFLQNSPNGLASRCVPAFFDYLLE